MARALAVLTLLALLALCPSVATSAILPDGTPWTQNSHYRELTRHGEGRAGEVATPAAGTSVLLAQGNYWQQQQRQQEMWRQQQQQQDMLRRQQEDAARRAREAQESARRAEQFRQQQRQQEQARQQQLQQQRQQQGIQASQGLSRPRGPVSSQSRLSFGNRQFSGRNPASPRASPATRQASRLAAYRQGSAFTARQRWQPAAGLRASAPAGAPRIASAQPRSLARAPGVRLRDLAPAKIGNGSSKSVRYAGRSSVLGYPSKTADIARASKRPYASSRPPTQAEIRRGFTGRFTADGRAIVKVRGRTFALRLPGTKALRRIAAVAASGGGGRTPPEEPKSTPRIYSNTNQRILEHSEPSDPASRSAALVTFFKAHGFDSRSANSYSRAFRSNQPVVMRIIPKGTILLQYGASDRIGQWFTYDSPMDTLAIPPLLEPGKQRIPIYYEVAEDISVIEGIAADLKYNAEDFQHGDGTVLKGGGVQLFTFETGKMVKQ